MSISEITKKHTIEKIESEITIAFWKRAQIQNKKTRGGVIETVRALEDAFRAVWAIYPRLHEGSNREILKTVITFSEKTNTFVAISDVFEYYHDRDCNERLDRYRTEIKISFDTLNVGENETPFFMAGARIQPRG